MRWVSLKGRESSRSSFMKIKEIRGRQVSCDQRLLSLRERRNQLLRTVVHSEAKWRGTQRRYRSGGWLIQHARAEWRSLLGCSLSCDAHQRATDGRAGRSGSAHPSSLPVSRCQSLRGEPWVDARWGVGPAIRMGLKVLGHLHLLTSIRRASLLLHLHIHVYCFLVARILQRLFLLQNKYIISYSHFWFKKYHSIITFSFSKNLILFWNEKFDIFTFIKTNICLFGNTLQ